MTMVIGLIGGNERAITLWLMTTLRTTINHGAWLVLRKQISISWSRLTSFGLLYDISRLEDADRLLVLVRSLARMLEAWHLANNLLLFLHTEQHIIWLNSDRRLSLMPLQGWKVRISCMDLVRRNANHTLLFHTVYVFKSLIYVTTTDHLVQREALACNLLLNQSIRLWCWSRQPIVHIGNQGLLLLR